MTEVEILPVISREGMFWDRGDSSSKNIEWGSHRGTWAGFPPSYMFDSVLDTPWFSSTCV